MPIGLFDTEKLIDSYGSVSVYTGHHTESGQSVLITVIMPSLSEAPLWIARLKAIRALQHPNIVRSSGGGQTPEGILYLAVSRLPVAIPPGAVLSLSAALALSQQVSAALDYAHTEGVIHGALGWLHVVRQGETAAVKGFELTP